MRLYGRIEPGSGAGQSTGQPHFFANSGFSPALYLILGRALWADDLVAATAAALRMALLVAENAVGADELFAAKAAAAARLVLLLAVTLVVVGAVVLCSVQAVRRLMRTNSRKACRHD